MSKPEEPKKDPQKTKTEKPFELPRGRFWWNRLPPDWK